MGGKYMEKGTDGGNTNRMAPLVERGKREIHPTIRDQDGG